MVLENLSKEELKELCKQKGLSDYANLSKPRLIRILNSLENPEEEEKLVEIVAEAIAEVKEEPKPIVKTPKVIKEVIKEIKVLSPQAARWKTHLKQLNITPKDYLTRFPDHMYKRYIEELI